MSSDDEGFGATAMNCGTELAVFMIGPVYLGSFSGERYPVLERVEGTAAYLDDIAKPLAMSSRLKPRW
jgi:hypothetical protein